MLLFAAIFVATVAVSALLNRNDVNTVMAEYCNAECKENKIRDNSICC